MRTVGLAAAAWCGCVPAAAQCGLWTQPFGPGGPNSILSAVTTWDHDGLASTPRHLVFAGLFTAIGPVSANRVARWDGTSWHALGSGIGGAGTLAMIVWDPDGPGPAPEVLVVGGSFASAGGAVAQGLAMWDGVSWSAPAAGGVAGNIRSLAVWDPDGPGPAPARLVVGGLFTSAGSIPANNIAVYDGTSWQALGTGTSAVVNTMTSWDPDGPGPLNPRLFAGGMFATAGGVTVNGTAQWDGVAWSGMNAGVTGSVMASTTWDPDGPGPAIPLLVIGGALDSISGVPTRGVAWWNGSSWQNFAGGVDAGVCMSLTVWDGDGAGPAKPVLVAGGIFNSVGGSMTARNVARWDGVMWKPFGVGSAAGVSGTVSTMTAWDPDGAAARAPMLVVGGSFNAAGGVAAMHNAAWSECLPPCPGDADGDLAVTFADLNIVLGSFGQAGQFVPGDVNGDGVVTFADLNIVLGSFGAQCG